jgi:hypothetical protein
MAPPKFRRPEGKGAEEFLTDGTDRGCHIDDAEESGVFLPANLFRRSGRVFFRIISFGGDESGR